MIITVAIPCPLRRSFDYLPPTRSDGQQLKPGVRVRVPFGRRSVVGLVLGTKQQSDQPQDKLRPIEEIIDDVPLVDEPSLKLYLWAADYYQHPVGDALFSILPSPLRRGALPPDNLICGWQLSVHGKGLGDNGLSRAKKQQQLLACLRKEGPIGESQLKAEGYSRAVISALEKKGLIEPVALLPHKARCAAPLLRTPHHPLRKDQQSALEALDFNHFGTYLLFGDTGTGKTEVYLQAIEKVVTAGKQALVLVPEINLTPQTLARFRSRFSCDIAVVHSGMTDTQRLQHWGDAKTGQTPIIIGTRSAVFTPLADPGIIILDEEHDPSFKQQDGFRYSARDVAVMRGSREGIPVILGSATPSLESLANCQRGRYRQLDLTERNNTAAPTWQTIDLRGTDLKAGFSAPLLKEIDGEITKGNQVLVFLNRRGYAPLLLCHDCGWQAQCQRCSVKMTAHLGRRKMICHHCEWQRPLPSTCPECQSVNIQFVGQGTERSEEVLITLFPTTRIIRLDRDSTRRKDAMQNAIAEIHRNEPCILVGTQMIAKGHHFPSVTLAAILNVDSGLFSTDFRAVERMAQIITQVAGRAGRGEKPGKVLLQSHYADHPLLAELMKADYRNFARLLLAERRVQGLPPFTSMAIIQAEAPDPAKAEDFLQKARGTLEKAMPSSSQCHYLGPLPAALEKRKNHFRYALSIFCGSRTRLAAALRQSCLIIEQQRVGQALRWSVDVDPQETP